MDRHRLPALPNLPGPRVGFSSRLCQVPPLVDHPCAWGPASRLFLCQEAPPVGVPAAVGNSTPPIRWSGYGRWPPRECSLFEDNTPLTPPIERMIFFLQPVGTSSPLQDVLFGHLLLFFSPQGLSSSINRLSDRFLSEKINMGLPPSLSFLSGNPFLQIPPFSPCTFLFSCSRVPAEFAFSSTQSQLEIFRKSVVMLSFELFHSSRYAAIHPLSAWSFWLESLRMTAKFFLSRRHHLRRHGVFIPVPPLIPSSDISLKDQGSSAALSLPCHRLLVVYGLFHSFFPSRSLQPPHLLKVFISRATTLGLRAFSPFVSALPPSE